MRHSAQNLFQSMEIIRIGGQPPFLTEGQMGSSRSIKPILIHHLQRILDQRAKSPPALMRRPREAGTQSEPGVSETMVEPDGIEPTTYSLQSYRSPN